MTTAICAASDGSANVISSVANLSAFPVTITSAISVAVASLSFEEIISVIDISANWFVRVNSLSGISIAVFVL